MAGFDLIAVSGIDGKFEDFDSFLGCRFPQYRKFVYEKSLSFTANCESMRQKLAAGFPDGLVILGWSIGAPAALALAEMCGITSCVMINSFFNRKTVLNARGISIAENDNVAVSDFSVSGKSIMILAGSCDGKIPCTESFKLFCFLSKNNRVNLFIEAGASHTLTSFSQETASLLERQIRKG
jgi:hypothetical protein